MTRKDEIKVLLEHLQKQVIITSAAISNGGALMPRTGDHIDKMQSVMCTMQDLRQEWKDIRE